MSNFKPNPAGIEAAGRAAVSGVTAHLNKVSAQVHATHAGRPVEEVLQELLRVAKTPAYAPKADGLRRATEAISRGDKITFS
jgi:hypothetical protein